MAENEVNEIPIYLTHALSKLIAQARETLSPKDFLLQQSELITTIRAIQFTFKSYPNDPIERAKKIHALIDEEIKKLKPTSKYKIACKEGCSNCCHLKVVITEDEIKLLKSLGVPFDEKRLREQLPLKAGKPYPVEKTKCVFLSKTGRCKVYEHRPMTCRKYFVVTDPKYCLTSKPEQIGILSFNSVEVIVSAVYDHFKTFDSFAEGFLNDKPHAVL